MRLTYIFAEPPFPPRHGAQIDIWRRMQAFGRLGVIMQVVFWTKAPLPQDVLDALRSVAVDVVPLPLPVRPVARMSKLGHLLRYPWMSAQRVLNERDRSLLLRRAEEFAPDAVWLDGIWAAPTALLVARHLGIALFTRSHNIEHSYMTGQKRLSRSLSARLQVSMSCLHLEHFEAEVLQRSRLFFDISTEDLNYWRQRGFQNGRWLPPLADKTMVRLEPPHRAPDSRPVIAFVGNLRTPNNISGITWFIESVMPSICESEPDAQLVIAGSSPSREFVASCVTNPNIRVIADPPNINEVYGLADVLINPAVWSSGVNLKSVDMLSSGKPVISTRMGVRGLPDDALVCFSVSDDAEAFSGAVVRALRNRESPSDHGQLIQRLFGDEAAGRALLEMEEVMNRDRALDDLRSA